MTISQKYIGKTVIVKMDRPLGSKHPKHGFVYEVNYGFVPDTVSGDGEEIDAYVLGIQEPVEEFTGKCIALIHRVDDDDDKLIIVPDGIDFTDDEIEKMICFQEKWFKHIILRKRVCNVLDQVNNDVCFQTENSKRFRLRAAAIIIENGCVLFATNDVEKYYYSIGGGVEIGETAEEAVLREVYEETGICYEIDRLAFIEENFFARNDGAMKGLACHEITFFFLMKPRGTQEINSHSMTFNETIVEKMCWLPIAELSKYEAYPKFFEDKLQNMKPYPEHIITKQ